MAVNGAVTAGRDSARRVVFAVVPYAQLIGLVILVWWAGAWLLPFALFALAAYRCDDPQRLRLAVELLMAATGLLLAALVLIVQCLKIDQRS
jgi:hypothetical protein